MGSDPEALDPDAVGLADDAVRMTGLSKRDAFAKAVMRRRVRTIADNPLLAHQAIDTQVDKRIDLAALFRARDWVGAVKPVKARPKEDYPTALEDQLKVLERQFILRNLGRAVRDEDPNEPMPFTTETAERPKFEALMADAKDFRHEAPTLITETNLDRVRAELAWRVEFLSTMDWGRFFSVEARKHHTGPTWKYHPDSDEARAALAKAEAEGRATHDDEEATP